MALDVLDHVFYVVAVVGDVFSGKNQEQLVGAIDAVDGSLGDWLKVLTHLRIIKLNELPRLIAKRTGRQAADF